MVRVPILGIRVAEDLPLTFNKFGLVFKNVLFNGKLLNESFVYTEFVFGDL